MICCAFTILAIIVLAVLCSPVILFLIAAGYVADKIGGGATGELTYAEAVALEYPYLRMFKTRAAVDAAFAAIREYKLDFVRADYKILNMPGLTRDQLLFRGDDPAGHSTIISMRPEDYDTMNWVSDWFNEKSRLACRRYDENESPLEYWASSKNNIIEYLRDRGPITAQLLHDAVYKAVRGCNNFRPGLMSGFIRWLGAESVLDFSAGHGDRLIGAIAAGVPYTGVDPNKHAHEGYREIIRTFCSEGEDNYTMICAPFQTAELPMDGDKLRTYDLIFTSPPYFDLEIYSDDKTQSAAEFPELDSWFEGFLMTSLRKCWNVLNDDGHMVVIINNIRDKPDYVMRMIEQASAFTSAEYLGVVSYADRIEDKRNPGKFYHKSPQPMWIWRKKAGTSPGAALANSASGAAANNITIEPLDDRHVDELAPIAAEDMMRNVAAGKPWSRERILELIRYAKDDEALHVLKRQYYHRAIMKNKHVIGYVGLYPLSPPIAIGDDAQPLQVRIFITSSEQRQGYGLIAVDAMINDYATLLGPEAGRAIYWQTSEDNTPSAKLAQRCGFVEVSGDFSVDGNRVRRFVRKLKK